MNNTRFRSLAIESVVFATLGMGLVDISSAACTMTVGNNTAYPNLSAIPWPSTPSPAIQPSDPQNRPELQKGIVVRNSSYITVTGLNAANVGQYAAVVLDQGSHHITIDQVFAHDSTFGISIGTAVTNGLGGPAGIGNVIKNNNVGTNVSLNGISVSNGSGGVVPVSDPNYLYATTISKNNVSGNGGHAIDVDASRNVKIAGNRIQTNGFAGGGYSGIHLFAPADNNSCGNNLVRYNYVSDTRTLADDASGTDGNGIQIDHFCDYNTVAFNVAWSNHGAGISIYTTAHNQVYGNSLAFNSNRSNRAINFPPAGNPTGDLVMAACDAANPTTGQSDCIDRIVHAGRTHNNHIFDNLIHSAVYGGPAINVTNSASSSAHNNVVGPNLLWVSNSTYSGPSANWVPLFYGGPTTQFSSIYIDSTTGTNGNLMEYPWSLSEASPGPVTYGGMDGFKLVKKPSGVGYALPLDLPDIAGRLPTASSSNFGAYYCSAPIPGATCAP